MANQLSHLNSRLEVFFDENPEPLFEVWGLIKHYEICLGYRPFVVRHLDWGIVYLRQ